ncbi:unnamed protein product [Clonostachys rosea]|uniref:Uncharacterized protein n=1 Tax=Bionectria ochroleuca TaxID=29856 RepID=A0ABY6U5B4_BIOOC|nr:unnamed protein product [Clonostachys rosea]
MSKNSDEELALLANGGSWPATTIPASHSTEGSRIQLDWCKETQRDRELQVAICRTLADLSINQYRSYIQKVRSAGMEPRDLLSDAGIPELDQGEPSQDFWCLVAARDRLIANSNELRKLAAEDVSDAESSAKNWCLTGSAWLACTVVAGFQLSVPAAAAGLLTTLVSFGRAAFFGRRARIAKSSVKDSDTFIESAANWDLDDTGRDGHHTQSGLLSWSWRSWCHLPGPISDSLPDDRNEPSESTLAITWH